MIMVGPYWLSLSLIANLFVGVFAYAAEPNSLCQAVVLKNAICEKPTTIETQKEQSCQIEWTANQCNKLIKENPELVIRDKVKSCDTAVTCERPQGVFDYLKTCKQSIGAAASDLGAFAIGVITGTAIAPTEEELLKQDFFKKCTSADCKRNMLGKFASSDYFSEEEISGHKDKIAPGDIASQNYNEGYSAAVLYRKLLLKLKSDFKNKGMTEKFIKPWNNEEAKLPRSVDEMINDALDDAGIQNTACLKPEVVAELRCYAATMLFVPAASGLAISASLRSYLGLSGKADVAVRGGGRVAGKGQNLKIGKANFSNGTKTSKITSQENSINNKMWNLREGIEDGSLSGPEIEKMSTDISQDLVQTLKDQGYSAKVVKLPQDENGNFVVGVELEPRADTRGGKTLASAQQKLNVKYILSPTHQAAIRDLMGMHDKGTVMLPIESVTTKAIGTDITTLHELRHAMFAKKLKEGKSTPYYGEVEALGQNGIFGEGGYDGYLSFEEMSTYYRAMKQSQQTSARPFPDSMYMPADKNLTKSSAAELERISYAVRDSVRTSRRSLEEPKEQSLFGKPENVRYYRDPATNQVAAEIINSRNGSPVSRTTYWLVDAKDPKDLEKNRQILLRYLDQIENTATTHLKAAQQVLGH